MALDPVNNGDAGSVARAKINAMISGVSGLMAFQFFAASYGVGQAGVNAAIAAANAAGGGDVILSPGAMDVTAAFTTRGSGVRFVGRNVTWTVTAPVAGVLCPVVDDAICAGMIGENFKIDMNARCESWLEDQDNPQHPIMTGMEIVGWKMGVHWVCNDDDMAGYLFTDNHIHSPRAAKWDAPLDEVLIYPINIGGGPNWRDVIGGQFLNNVIEGKGGNYQTNNGTADQIGLQNHVNCVISNNRSSMGGENGIALARLSAGNILRNNKTFMNDGYGIQIGSGAARLKMTDVTGLVEDVSDPGGNIFSGTNPTRRCRISKIRAESGFYYVFVQAINAVWDVTDTLGGHAISEVTFGDAGTVQDNTCYNNSVNSAGTYDGMLVSYSRDGASFFDGNRCFDDQVIKTQGVGISFASCVDVFIGANDVSGNLNAGYDGSNSIIRRGESWQEKVSANVLPTLPPGSSAVVEFPIPGVNVRDAVSVAISGNTSLMVNAHATVANKVKVFVVNVSDVTYNPSGNLIYSFNIVEEPEWMSASAIVPTLISARSNGATRQADSATVNNSTTLVSDDTLSFTLAANEVRAFQAVIHFNSGATPAIKFGLSVPAGASGKWIANTVGTTVDIATAVTSTGAASDRMVTINGYVANGSTAGTVALQFAQNVADPTDTVLLAGSSLRVVPG